jgi:hypothetical protein
LLRGVGGGGEGGHETSSGLLLPQSAILAAAEQTFLDAYIWRRKKKSASEIHYAARRTIRERKKLTDANKSVFFKNVMVPLLG